MRTIAKFISLALLHVTLACSFAARLRMMLHSQMAVTQWPPKRTAITSS